MTMTQAPQQALLFDLDGTLIDSAKDIVNSLIEVFTANGMRLEPSQPLTQAAGEGRASLLQTALGEKRMEDDQINALSEQFSATYAQRMCETTRPYPGIEDMLATLNARGISWGIVTNKLGHLGKPLIRKLGLADHAACLVFGDTTEKKPSPEPLFHAAEQIGIATDRCIFVGDTENDIIAGNRAGATTVAVMQTNPLREEVLRWSADAVLDKTCDILGWLDSRQASCRKF